MREPKRSHSQNVPEGKVLSLLALLTSTKVQIMTPEEMGGTHVYEDVSQAVSLNCWQNCWQNCSQKGKARRKWRSWHAGPQVSVVVRLYW